MDSRDEKLTLENVDEQVEQLLSLPPEIEPPTMIALARTVRNLQSMYEEDRRLEQVWTRVKGRMPALSMDNAIKPIEEISMSKPTAHRKRILQHAYGESLNSILRRPNKPSQQPSHWNWSNLGIGLVAAILLISFLGWSMWSYVLHGSLIAGTQSATPTTTLQIQPTVNLSDMQAYTGQYFKIQYPANWKISSIDTKGISPYLQTVQFRPLATSAVEINVDTLPGSNYSNDQLLQMDPDVKLGTLLNTKTVTYHGIPWTVGIVELPSSTHAQKGKLEIAYANQGDLRRVELNAASDMFDPYAKVFDAMLASFYPQSGLATAPTATPPQATVPPATATPKITATPTISETPTPTVDTPDIKDYINQYFKIQYPANWVITNVIQGDGYQQTVQFRPSANSPIFVNVSVLNSSNLSSALLLLTDPDIKLGTLLSTDTTTYHGISWTVGLVNLVSSLQAQPNKVQVAYSNQHAPYKIEFGAPQDTFNANTKIFNAMFASFYPAS